MVLMNMKVVDICTAVLPDEKGKFATEIDMFHCVGRKRDMIQKARAVILLFISRHIRDLLGEMCKEKRLSERKEVEVC